MSVALEINCETGIVTERPLTAEEIATNEAAATAAAASVAALQVARPIHGACMRLHEAGGRGTRRHAPAQLKVTCYS